MHAHFVSTCGLTLYTVRECTIKRKEEKERAQREEEARKKREEEERRRLEEEKRRLELRKRQQMEEERRQREEEEARRRKDEERRARELEAERKRKLEQEQERENMNRFGCFWAPARNFLLLNSAQSDVNISLDGSPIAFWFYLNISRIMNFLTL